MPPGAPPCRPRTRGLTHQGAQSEALGSQPASATIVRICGGWNAAKEQAGLEMFGQSSGGGVVAPRPDWVDLPDDAEKRDSVASLVARGFAREKLRAEIDECQVLCANCHRKEHYSVPDAE